MIGRGSLSLIERARFKLIRWRVPCPSQRRGHVEKAPNDMAALRLAMASGTVRYDAYVQEE